MASVHRELNDIKKFSKMMLDLDVEVDEISIDKKIFNFKAANDSEMTNQDLEAFASTFNKKFETEFPDHYFLITVGDITLENYSVSELKRVFDNFSDELLGEMGLQRKPL